MRKSKKLFNSWIYKMKFKNKPNKYHNINGNIIWDSRSVTVVGVVILYKDSKTYVLTSIRGPIVEDESGKINLVGGYLDRNETATEAFIRECWEETGFNLPMYMEKYKIITENITKEWSTNSNPDRHITQNVSFRFGVVLEVPKGEDFPVLTTKYNEVEGESIDPKWLSINDIDKIEWAFDHQNLIKHYLLYSQKEILKNEI